MQDRKTDSEAWFGLTTEGLSALASGDVRTASSAWSAASDLAEQSDLSAPRKAAAQNNAGVVHLLNSRGREARRSFAQARRHWAHARRSLQAEPLAVPGASSVFHLRLAMQHHDRFAQMHRERTIGLCRLARAITALNRSVATARDCRGRALAALASEVSGAFGGQCAELAILSSWTQPSDHGVALGKLYHQKADTVARLGRGDASSEIGKEIELAARLTVLMHPALLCTKRDDAAHSNEGTR